MTRERREFYHRALLFCVALLQSHASAALMCGPRKKRMEAVIRYRTILWFRLTSLAPIFIAVSTIAAADLKMEAAQGYAHYVQLTEQRMKPELAPGGAFLSVDAWPESKRAEAYARLQRGEVVAARL